MPDYQSGMQNNKALSVNICIAVMQIFGSETIKLELVKRTQL